MESLLVQLLTLSLTLIGFGLVASAFFVLELLTPPDQRFLRVFRLSYSVALVTGLGGVALFILCELLRWFYYGS